MIRELLKIEIFMDRLSHFILEFGIELLYTVRAQAVCQFGFGVLDDVFFNFVPIAPVVANLFAVAADGQHASQGFDVCQGVL